METARTQAAATERLGRKVKSLKKLLQEKVTAAEQMVQRELPGKSCYCSLLGSIWAGSAASPCPQPCRSHCRGLLEHGGVGGCPPGEQLLPHGLAMNPGERSALLLFLPETESKRSILGGKTPPLVGSFCTEHPRRAGGCCAGWQGGQRCQTPCGQPGCAPAASSSFNSKLLLPQDGFRSLGLPSPQEPCSSCWGGTRTVFQESFSRIG